MVYKVDNSTLATILVVVRFCIMFCIYVGFTCVINLTVQFFAVYLGIWIADTVNQFIGWDMKKPRDLMDNAKGTINFCPMLAILFVGTRMRALMITNNKGAPQGWVQDGMYMATWAVLIQFLMVLVVGISSGGPVPVDEDGTPKWEPANPILTYVALGLKWLTFLFLYGGVIAVIVGVYTMTPEAANGRGAVPLVGDGKVPGTEVGVPGYKKLPEPVGPNDVPGASARHRGQ